MHLAEGLNYLDQKEVADAAFLVINQIQSEKPAMQVAAMSVLFLLLTDVLDLNARDQLDKAEAIMTGADKRYNYTFNAIREYIKEELKRKTL